MEEEYQRRSQDKEKKTKVKDEKKGEKEEKNSNVSEGKKSSVGDNFDVIEIPFIEYEKEDFLKVNNAFACTLLDVDLKFNPRLKNMILGSFEKYKKEIDTFLMRLKLMRKDSQDEVEDKHD